MKTRYKFFLSSVLTLYLVMGVVACKSVAYVSCTNVEKFQSNAGVINVARLDLGDIVVLDTVEKTAQWVMHSSILPENLSATNPIDTFQVLTQTGFTIDLGGKVAKANESVQADVKSVISRQTTFLLTNSYRKNIVVPANEINRQDIISSLKDILENNNNVVCMLISGIIYADNFEFRVKKGVANEIKANVIKVGDFRVNVSYECQGSLNIDAKNGGVFFKSSLFKLTPQQNRFVLFAKEIDLSKYSMVNTLRQNISTIPKQ